MRDDKKTKELKEKREYWRTRFFWLTIEIAFIFAIPAFAGLFLGKKLVSQYKLPGYYLYLTLIGAFILSWLILYWRYRSIKRNLDKVEQEIEESKNA